jgi:hypothetical protein
MDTTSTLLTTTTSLRARTAMSFGHTTPIASGAPRAASPLQGQRAAPLPRHAQPGEPNMKVDFRARTDMSFGHTTTFASGARAASPLQGQRAAPLPRHAQPGDTNMQVDFRARTAMSFGHTTMIASGARAASPSAPRPPQAKPGDPQTELCRHWSGPGVWCPRGMECLFAHGEAELRPVRQRPYRIVACRNGASCRFGEDCHFKHD